MENFLHPDAHAIWDLLPDEAKAIIIGVHKPPNKHSANLHEISAFDFIQANLHELQLEGVNDPDNPTPISEGNHVDNAPTVSDHGNEFLAYLSKQLAPSHPGHLVNVLSTNVSKNSQGAKYLGKSHSCTPSPPKDNEIVVNGKKY